MKRHLFFWLFVCVLIITPLFSTAQHADAQNDTKEEDGISSADIKQRVEGFRDEGEINDDQSAHALTLHLTAVERFEKKDEEKKVIKHMEGFISLLNHQRDNEQMSKEAYEALESDAN